MRVSTFYAIFPLFSWIPGYPRNLDSGHREYNFINVAKGLEKAGAVLCQAWLARPVKLQEYALLLIENYYSGWGGWWEN